MAVHIWADTRVTKRCDHCRRMIMTADRVGSGSVVVYDASAFVQSTHERDGRLIHAMPDRGRHVCQERGKP